jgi:hypothetical protein
LHYSVSFFISINKCIFSPYCTNFCIFVLCPSFCYYLDNVLTPRNMCKPFRQSMWHSLYIIFCPGSVSYSYTGNSWGSSNLMNFGNIADYLCLNYMVDFADIAVINNHILSHNLFISMYVEIRVFLRRNPSHIVLASFLFLIKKTCIRFFYS